MFNKQRFIVVYTEVHAAVAVVVSIISFVQFKGGILDGFLHCSILNVDPVVNEAVPGESLVALHQVRIHSQDNQIFLQLIVIINNSKI